MYDEIITKWKNANPLECHRLGIHDHDGELPDLSLEAINNRISEIKEDLEYLQKSDKPTETIDLYEYELIKSALKKELFELDIRQEFRDNPVQNVFPLALVEMSYTQRNFASIEQRVRNIVDLEKQIPRYLDQALELYNDSLPAAKLGMAIQ
ncbi:MAG: DUF885 family protein, partial [Candidatus Kariarchaeaceae archaeon]